MRGGRKGQDTNPKPIRDRTGIEPGTEVEFGFDGDTITMRRSKQRKRPGLSRGEKLVRAIAGTATRNRHLSTDEIMKLLRGDD
jgi:bifunctional DNA-binding transcriptional regulator/antitoxin component of YhaV-PrlF toxin-antitoxin module